MNKILVLIANAIRSFEFGYVALLSAMAGVMIGQGIGAGDANQTALGLIMITVTAIFHKISVLFYDD